MRSRVVVPMVVLVCGALGLAGCTSADGGTDEAGPSVIAPGKPGESNRTLSPDEAKSSTPVEEPNNADFTYVEMMIVHHQQAIEMTDLAVDRAIDKQVKGISARIADAQGPEIKMMNQWLKDNGRKPIEAPGEHSGHGGHAGPDHSDMPGMASNEQMKKLAAARGSEFDKLFLKLMIKHHEGALTMAGEVQNAGSVQQVQEMANDVIATQSAEIKKMKAMLRSA